MNHTLHIPAGKPHVHMPPQALSLDPSLGPSSPFPSFFSSFHRSLHFCALLAPISRIPQDIAVFILRIYRPPQAHECSKGAAMSLMAAPCCLSG